MELSNAQVAELVRKLGKPRSRVFGPRIDIDLEMAKAMIARGFSMAQVAEHFGCSSMTVRRRLRARPATTAQTANVATVPGRPWAPYR